MISLDDECRELVRKNRNMHVPWVLMTSYLYYVGNDNIISDHTFDWMLKRFHRLRVNIKHRHKALIRRNCTSLHYLGEDAYPGMCKAAALSLLAKVRRRAKRERRQRRKRG